MGVIKDERREEREGGGGSSSSVEYFSFREQFYLVFFNRRIINASIEELILRSVQ
jgi:hypothetical protein